MTMKEERPKQDELVEAQIKLQQAHQRKVEECSKEINEILGKYGFQLNIDHIINIVPKR